MHRKFAAPSPAAVAAIPALTLALAVAACGPGRETAPAPAVPRVLVQEAPSAAEDYCAWYGSREGGILYFGQAPFWSAFRGRGGDPQADLREPGPQLVGRLDLGRGELLPPLDVTAPGARSGVWDVLARPDGRVWFTTFFESVGWVDTGDGRVTWLPAAGPGLNELAPGPDGGVLASRYGDGNGSDGSVVLLAPDGTIRAEHVLAPVPGHIVAAKSVAWDPVHREIWVNTDLVALDGGEGGHDARVLSADGAERVRIHEPEVQFVAFRADGIGLVVEAEPDRLWARILAPDDPAADPARRGRRVLLDGDYVRTMDFAQDVQFGGRGHDGQALVTTWSGRVHVVDLASGAVASASLPPPGEEGLYYTGALHGRRLCATLCDGVKAVCAPAPAPR